MRLSTTGSVYEEANSDRLHKLNPPSILAPAKCQFMPIPPSQIICIGQSAIAGYAEVSLTVCRTRRGF